MSSYEANGEFRYNSMKRSDLERLAVSAIREHRRLLAADEVVYEEWTRATDDPSISMPLAISLMFPSTKNDAQTGHDWPR
ncbi:transcriptional repressor TraM [Rhizobium leguminosarum]|uniref:transcriptional repressor TraM n=1 Tax=Rhizobium leguminosarum TaxID=384 RepID=UPI001FEE6288|nr:transcriptional repressor TraM [Rhizobium leguminosarum]